MSTFALVASEELRSVHSGSVCLTDKRPTPSIYCSWKPDPAARTVDALSGKVTTPTIFINPSMFEQTERKESVSIPHMDEPSLVSSTSKQPDRPSNPPPSNSQHLDKLTGYKPPKGNGGPPGDPITRKDFQMELSKSSGSHGGPQQRQHTLVHGDVQ